MCCSKCHIGEHSRIISSYIIICAYKMLDWEMPALNNNLSSKAHEKRILFTFIFSIFSSGFFLLSSPDSIISVSFYTWLQSYIAMSIWIYEKWDFFFFFFFFSFSIWWARMNAQISQKLVHIDMNHHTCHVHIYIQWQVCLFLPFSIIN